MPTPKKLSARRPSARLNQEIKQIVAGHGGHAPATTATMHGYPLLRIDKSRVPTSLQVAALRSAELDPDGEIFPWRDEYPLVGQTVYADGALWSVWTKQRGEHQDEPGAVVKLVNEVTHEESTKTRDECRPVTWTQTDEDALAARATYRPGRPPAAEASDDHSRLVDLLRRLEDPTRRSLAVQDPQLFAVLRDFYASTGRRRQRWMQAISVLYPRQLVAEQYGTAAGKELRGAIQTVLEH